MAEIKTVLLLCFSFERQQVLVQEQLARLAQREKETVASAGLEELMPALIIEKGKVREEQEKTKMLVSKIFGAFDRGQNFVFH